MYPRRYDLHRSTEGHAQTQPLLKVPESFSDLPTNDRILITEIFKRLRMKNNRLYFTSTS